MIEINIKINSDVVFNLEVEEQETTDNSCGIKDKPCITKSKPIKIKAPRIVSELDKPYLKEKPKECLKSENKKNNTEIIQPHSLKKPKQTKRYPLTDIELLKLYLQKACELRRFLTISDIDDDPRMPGYAIYQQRIGGITNINDKIGFMIDRDSLNPDMKEIINSFCADCTKARETCGMDPKKCLVEGYRKYRGWSK